MPEAVKRVSAKVFWGDFELREPKERKNPEDGELIEVSARENSKTN